MRWHVGIREHGVPVWSEHVETLDLVRSTADELIQGAHQKLGIGEEVASRAHKEIVDTEFEAPEPGVTWDFQLGNSGGKAEILVGVLDEGDTDEDCPFCEAEPD